jgi:hypothetical protein
MAEFWPGKRGRAALLSMPPQMKCADSAGFRKNQFDRPGGAVMFRHGRALGSRGSETRMDAATGLRSLLNQAYAVLAEGDAPAAERVARAVSALIRAERDLAELEAAARAAAPEEDDEALRAEIRSRVARFVDADRAGAPAAVLERLARETFEG